MVEAHVGCVELERRLEGDDISGEQLMVATVHLLGNNDAFEFHDITDDEAVLATKADAKVVNTRTLNRHKRIRNRVRTVFYHLPFLGDITKKKEALYEGDYNLEDCERNCRKWSVRSRVTEKILKEAHGGDYGPNSGHLIYIVYIYICLISYP